jgi:predicted dehydrogenase
MMSRGVEKWHPNPEFFYKVGGGPLLDMGPYYLTALVNLVGGFEYVQSVAVKGFQQRLVKSQPKFGTVIDVETPTHINGLLVCKSGVVGTLTTSFDVHKHSMPWIEIYGSDGTLSVPDPNTFGGKVRLFREDAEDWETVPLIDGYPENSRGLGIHDMANAVITGGSFRADSSLTFHVLETMHAMLKAGECGCKVGLKSFCERPRAWREKPGALWIETNE